jgi:transposase
MLTISHADRLFICNTPISMRKSFEGLSNIIEEKFPGELLTGSFFIFLNRQRGPYESDVLE